MTKTFKLIRDHDVSGISGTGVVVEGMVFSDGHAVVHWVNSSYPTTTPHPEGLSSVMHIHGHDGKTRLVWDGEGPGALFDEDDLRGMHLLLDRLDVFHPSRKPLQRVIRKIRAAMTSQTVP